MPNAHWILLFYYVVKFGGIAKAARLMPRRLDKSSISAQMKALESVLGVSLFERGDSLKLTVDGDWLYNLARPLFESLEDFDENLPSRRRKGVRIGASETVFAEYLPEVITAARQRVPDLEVNFRDGPSRELLASLERRELDLVVMATVGTPPTGFERLKVVSVPLVLMVPRVRQIESAKQFWSLPAEAHPLVAPSESYAICTLLKQGLRRMKLRREIALDVRSLSLLKRYVAANMGVGVTLDLPTLTRHPKIKAIRLPEFGFAEVNVFWRSPTTPPLDALLEAIRERVKQLWPDRAGAAETL